MRHLDIDTQFSNLKSRDRVNEGSISYQGFDYPQNYESINSSKTQTITDLEEEPSTLGVIILMTIVIFLYGCGVHQITNTVNNIVETVVEQVNQDHGFKVF